MRCGDICLVMYPFTDGSGAKLRPVLVISADKFNQGEDVVVLPITGDSNKDEAYCVPLESGMPYYARTGLKYDSAIKCTKPFTMAKRLLQRRLGHLHADLMGRVREILEELLVKTN